MRTFSGEPESISGNGSAGKIKRFLYIIAILSVVALLSAESGVISDFLGRNVIFEKEIGPFAREGTGGDGTLIYVLGGNQESLVPRFEMASGLYHRGVAGKIHILSRPGITEYSPELQRNLSNDEWSAMELEAFNVKRGDVVPVFLADPSFFGTMSEAMRVSKMVREKGYKRVVLVSSLHHTRRCFDSFSRFLSNIPVEIYIHGAGGRAGFTELVSENIKLLVYDHMILPIYALKN